MGANQSCPEVNTTIPGNGAQWSLSSGKWGNVKLGWLVAGLSTILTSVICIYTTYRHACNYHRPREQRQIIRILWMPWVFSIISFFSYRYYRKYIYYKLVIIVYESFCLTAFLALMLAYIGSSTKEQMKVMQSKDKRSLPWPFGVQFPHTSFIDQNIVLFKQPPFARPSKPYFLYALNGSVVQYAFVRPVISIIAMVCEAGKVLCADEFSIYYANLYLEVVDFTSISIALYGLVVFYTLVKERLEGKQPMTKFVVIKVVVALTYYQAFIFSAMASDGVIKANAYWSKSNISNGLNAIVICVEMVFVSGLMFWAYPASDYMAITKEGGMAPTKPWKALGQALNFWDFVMEGWRGLLFFKRWWQNGGKANGAGGAVDEKVGDDYDRDTNLDAYHAFKGPPRPQSATASKFEMFDVGAEAIEDRVQSLAYGQTSDSPRVGSYLEIDEDVEREASTSAGRRSGLFGGKSADTRPNSPSSFRSSSLYRTAFARSPTAPDEVPDEQNELHYKQPSAPGYGSLMAPGNVTPSSQYVAAKTLPTASEVPHMRKSSASLVPNPDSDRYASMRSATLGNGIPHLKATGQRQTSRDMTCERESADFSPSIPHVIDVEDNEVARPLQNAAPGQVEPKPERSKPGYSKPPLSLPGSRRSDFQMAPGSSTKALAWPDSPGIPDHDDVDDRPKSARVMALSLPETGQFSPLRF